MRKHLILLVTICLIHVGCQPNQIDRAPNVIVILTDDQGWGDLSIHGNNNLRTPHLDSLKLGGVSFDRFYVSPVCSPTRAELLTGRHHVRSGVYSTSEGGERFDLDETTMAEVFKEAGYQTAAYGKWHSGMQAPYHPNARGFDDFYGFASGHWGNYFDPVLERNGQLVQGEGFLVDDLTNKGISFITENKDRPFFLYLPYNTPHSPMQVPDRWWDAIQTRKLDLFNRNPSNEDTVFTKAALAMCENIDWNVGRLMATLKDLQINEQTIVVYLSDNGPNSVRWNDDMKGRKGSTDEGGVRSPLFIRWDSKIRAGKTIAQIASSIDILPTLAAFAGISIYNTKPLDGVSLQPLIMQDDAPWKDRLLFTYWRGRSSVRSQKFRLDNDGFLYDMYSDPGQRKGVTDLFPLESAQLKEALDQWQKEVLIELPSRDNRPFYIGHPDFHHTQIPARDGKASGNIQRSNRWPNCSFYTNWISEKDQITWDVEVLEDGNFDVALYYTCPSQDVGSTIELSFGDSRITQMIKEAHDPPLSGMEDDRTPRIESYVKDFRRLSVGQIFLKKGAGTLRLRAIEIPGSQVMDFRLMMLERSDPS